MLSYTELEELQTIFSDYESVYDFVHKNKTIDYYKYDHRITKKGTLFIVHENLDLKPIEETVDLIEKYLRYFLIIFEKPIIHLKEIETIVPIEMVHRIDSDTISYAAIHSELWSNFTAQGIEPRKLLTRTYDNNYCIYENQVFAQTVDDILRFLQTSLRNIRNLIFASQDLNFNLLERLDHTNYYYAIGKLHAGYLRNFNSFYSALPLCDRMIHLYVTIKSYCKFKVYRLNSRRPKRLRVKLTNIFKMQKTYHRVYLIAKKLNSLIPKPVEYTPKQLQHFDDSYFSYVLLLSIFAATHLDFTIGAFAKLSFKKFNGWFSFKSWRLNIKELKNKTGRAILLTIKYLRTYKILLIPQSTLSEKEFVLDKRVRPNEVVRVSPFISNRSSLFLSATDLDSFLRLQQLLLRAMVHTDSNHKKCPYCKGNLVPYSNTSTNAWVCKTCRTKISKITCPTTNKTYYATSIDEFVYDARKVRSLLFNEYDRFRAYHYRNITDINDFGDPLCPYCGKYHLH